MTFSRPGVESAVACGCGKKLTSQPIDRPSEKFCVFPRNVVATENPSGTIKQVNRKLATNMYFWLPVVLPDLTDSEPDPEVAGQSDMYVELFWILGRLWIRLQSLFHPQSKGSTL